MKPTKQKNRWMEKYAPLGINIDVEAFVYAGCMSAALVWSIGYLFRYLDERSMLYEIVKGKKVIIDGAMMPSFATLIDGSFDVFGIVILLLIGFIGYHYLYHYQGTKAIYLMKRLPNKWELHKRCIILPIGAILSTVVVMLVLQLLYYGIYLLGTPQQCLPI